MCKLCTMEGPHLEMRTDDGVLDATVLTIEQNIFVFLCMCMCTMYVM